MFSIARRFLARARRVTALVRSLLTHIPCHHILEEIKHTILPTLLQLLDTLFRCDDLSNSLDLLLPILHIRRHRLGVHDVEVAVVAAHVNLQSSVVAYHVQICGLLATFKRVEVVDGFAFGDSAALGEDGVFVNF